MFSNSIEWIIKNSLSVLVLIVSLFVMMIAENIEAHTSGVSLEQVVGEYLIDVGYSPEVLFEDSLVRFDFSILDNATKVEQPFTDIWVRIEEGENTVFAGGLAKARFGPTGLSYAFPNPGSYTIFVRYSNATSTLAETSFDIMVFEMTKETKFDWLFWAKVIGVAIGGTGLSIMIYWRVELYWSRRKQQATEQ